MGLHRQGGVEPRVATRPQVLIKRLGLVVVFDERLPKTEPESQLAIRQMRQNLPSGPLAGCVTALEHILARLDQEQFESFGGGLEHLDRIAVAERGEDSVDIRVHPPTLHSAGPRTLYHDGMHDLPEIPEIDVHQAKTRVERGAHLIDVREADEYQETRIPGAALFPLSEFGARYQELPRDRQIVIHCRSGQRSANATAFLRQHGYDAVNVEGGIVAWAEQGLPVEVGDD